MYILFKEKLRALREFQMNTLVQIANGIVLYNCAVLNLRYNALHLVFNCMPTASFWCIIQAFTEFKAAWLYNYNWGSNISLLLPKS